MSYYTGNRTNDELRNRLNPWFARQNHTKLAKQNITKTWVDTSLADDWHPSELFQNGEGGFAYDVDLLGTVFTDETFTTPAGVGDPVGGILDISGNDNHVIQTLPEARHILSRQPASGARNIVDQSDDISASPWTTNSATVIDAQTLSLASSVTSRIEQITDILRPNTAFTISATMWADNPVHVGKIVRLGAALADQTNQYLDVVLTDTPTRYVFSLDSAWTGNSMITARIAAAVENPEALTVKVTDIQVELSGEVSPYQRRVSEYDISEAGQPYIYFLAYDGVDDLAYTAAPVDMANSEQLTVCIGAAHRKVDAFYHVVIESGDNQGDQGEFGMFLPWNTADIRFHGLGGSRVNIDDLGTYNSVLTGIIEGPSVDLVLRKDQAIVGTEVNNQLGGKTTSVIYFGGRPSSGTIRYRGKTSSMLLINRVLTADELEKLEQRTAARTFVPPA